jgi:hypothetical protein
MARRGGGTPAVPSEAVCTAVAGVGVSREAESSGDGYGGGPVPHERQLANRDVPLTLVQMFAGVYRRHRPTRRKRCD